jgi:hypothetical protein
MNEEEKQLWKAYFCRATQWADTMTPEMYEVAIQTLTDLQVTPLLTALGKPVFTKTGVHDVDTVAEYIDNPKDCVKNPYVYGAMHHTTDLDAGWIKTVIKKRTDNYAEVERKIDSSAHELSKNVRACYDLTDAVEAVKNIMDIKDE